MTLYLVVTKFDVSDFETAIAAFDSEEKARAAAADLTANDIQHQDGIAYSEVQAVELNSYEIEDADGELIQKTV